MATVSIFERFGRSTGNHLVLRHVTRRRLQPLSLEESAVPQRIFSSLEELKSAVSCKLGPTEWLRIDQSRINEFAEATCDNQWIHVDVERARKGPYGETVAHGFLTMSLVGQFLPQMVKVAGVPRSINYGLERVRFPAVVRTGSYVRASAELLSTTDVAVGGVQAVYRIAIQEKDADKPACVVDLIIRYLSHETESESRVNA